MKMTSDLDGSRLHGQGRPENIFRHKIGFIPLSTIETEQRLFAGAWRRNFVSLKEIRNLGHVMSRDDVSEVDFDKMSN